MADETSNLVELLARFGCVSESPETFLEPPDSLVNETRTILKDVFDFLKKDETNSLQPLATLCPLQELIVDNFDDEQIWQEIQLQNEPMLKCLSTTVRDLKKCTDSMNISLQSLPDKSPNGNKTATNSGTKDKAAIILTESESEILEGSEEKSEGSNSDLESDKNSSTDNENEEHGKLANKKNEVKFRQKSIKLKGKHSSVVDDKFFKLSEMTEFLDQEDRRFEQLQKKKDKSGLNEEDDESDEGDDDESIDLFASLDSEDDDDNDGFHDAVCATAKMVGRSLEPAAKKAKSVAELRYGDYFDPPGGGMEIMKTKSHNDESDEEDDDNDDDMEADAFEDESKASGQSSDDAMEEDEANQQVDSENHVDQESKKEVLSSHEKKQLKIKQKIDKLEKENLARKPWQLSGESSSGTRPLNSLLEEELSFDHTTVAAPEITEETTKSLEDTIKQRIKDAAWDDVERKQKPTMEPFEYKKRQPLDQEKSKLSLSQIYEQEYLKQTQEASEEQENEEHKTIKVMMTKLFTKLDALSNFHFTPKPPKPELKVVTNAPSIAMEEVAPVAVSDAMLLAPEEIHEKKPELKGDTEKTATDRKRERRAKKLRQRERAHEKEKRKKLVSKLNPGLGNVYSKKDALRKLEKEGERNVSVVKGDGSESKTLKSSSAFFSQLEDKVKQTVKAKRDSGPSKKKKAKMTTSHLKL